MSLAFRSGVTAPPAYLVDRFYQPIRRVALVWATIARAYPVEVTSWWRDETRNAATPGSARYSQHLVGTAIDAVIVGQTRAQALPLVQRVAAYYGVQAPAKASHGSGNSVHVQGLAVGHVERILRTDPRVLAQAQAFVGPPRPIGV